jgi:hypothetical protein
MKYYIQVGGGLGDIFRKYFNDNPQTGEGTWGRLNKMPIKEREVLVVGAVHNREQVREFFKFHPLIKEVRLDPWVLNGNYVREICRQEGYEEVRQVYPLENYEWKRPKVYLSEADRKALLAIKKPYAVIAPFLGDLGYIPWSPDKYILVIEAVKNLGYEVAVLGGSYLREGGFTRDVITTVEIKEEFSYPGVVNFLGIGSRVSAQLVIDSDFYIGVHGCYAMVAQSFDKLNIIIHEDKMQKKFDTHGSEDCFAMDRPKTHAINITGKELKSVVGQIEGVIWDYQQKKFSTLLQ